MKLKRLAKEIHKAIERERRHYPNGLSAMGILNLIILPRYEEETAAGR